MPHSHLPLLTCFAVLPAAACSRLAGSGYKLSGLGAPLMGLFMALPFTQDAVTLGLATIGLWAARKMPLGNAVGPFMSRTEPATEKTADNPGPEWWQIRNESAELSIWHLGGIRFASVFATFYFPAWMLVFVGWLLNRNFSFPPMPREMMILAGCIALATPLACYAARWLQERADAKPDFGWMLQEWLFPLLAMALAAGFILIN